MTKREARAYVCRVLAATLREDISNGSGWIYDATEAKVTHSEGGELRNDADVARIEQAIRDEIASLDRRSKGSTE